MAKERQTKPCEWCMKPHERLDHKFCSRECSARAHVGHPVSQETRDRISKANTGKGGWHHSEKAKLAIGKAQLGRRRVDPSQQRMQSKLYGACIRMLKQVLLREGKRRSTKTEVALGYTREQLKEHLQKQFQTGMTWENMGKRGWHIDHIKPVNTFPLDSPPNVVNSLSNLRPLWEHENLSRPKDGSDIDKEEKK